MISTKGRYALRVMIELAQQEGQGYVALKDVAHRQDISEKYLEAIMKRLVQECGRPVIAEGGIWTPAQLKAALDTGVWAAVVGTAITRPREITKRFVAAMKQ